MNGCSDRFAGHIAVVGSGLAGLVTALALAPLPVLLITREGAGEATSSAWAQGGIAASLGTDDSAALHLTDTLAAGDGLCDRDAAETIITAAPAAIAMLERFGASFDRKPDGSFALGLEAAHGRRRIVHAQGDGSGAEIVRALVARAMQTPSIEMLAGVELRRLLTDDEGVCGLLCAGRDGEAFTLAVSRVVLATGGLGGLYDATTNPAGNYGQGIMLAARAGAVLADMEFVQFHPTALDSARYPLALVSEAVRGEGALLINDRGERFMAREPDAELAPRDIVARAISAEIAAGRRVFLDAREAIGADFASRFPNIDLLCREAGIDAASQPVPVRPAVHYHMGGVATDTRGRSSIPGLWVAGEAASTGLHGANRLASNSLLEAAVMGSRVAGDISNRPAFTRRRLPQVNVPVAAELAKIRPVVSRHLGIIRNGAGIDDAIADLLPLAEGSGPSADPAIVALLIAVFAKLRRESRGAHARSDFPAHSAAGIRRFMTLADVLAVARSTVSPSLAESA